MWETMIGMISVAVAIFALWLEARRSRISQQTDIMLRLTDRFKDSDMRKLRQTATEKLMKQSPDNDELSDVLDFFSILAALVKKKAFDLSLAYFAFDYWASRYWQCAQQHIAKERKYDPDSWTILAWLVQEFARIRERDRIPVELSDEVLAKFLREEAQREASPMET